MGLSRQLGDALAQQLRDHDQAVVGGARPLGWKVGAGAAEHLDGYVLGSLLLGVAAFAAGAKLGLVLRP